MGLGNINSSYPVCPDKVEKNLTNTFVNKYGNQIYRAESWVSSELEKLFKYLKGWAKII